MTSLRVRLAALVGLVSLVVLALAGWAVVEVVADRMRESVRNEAVRAVEKAAEDARDGLVSGSTPTEGLGEPEVRRFLDRRVRTADGTPSDALRSFGGTIPEVPEGETVVVRREVDGVPAFIAFTSGRDDDSNRFTLGAAAPLRSAERTIATFRTVTVLAVPTLGLLLAGLAALIAGRVLHPVAVMRAEADAISHGTLHRRLTPTTRSSELAALAATMNDMLDRLERSATSQRRLVSDVSHELRSPLATIRANLELAHGDDSVHGDAADGGDAAGAVALAEVDRLDEMVGALLTLSRLDEGGSRRTEDLDLEDLVSAQARAVARPPICIDTTAVAPARVHADRRAIVGLVRNLLDNAVRYAATTVRIALVDRGATVEITVQDDGPGVPPPHRQRIFERFARLDEGRSRDAGGAGLGLAVAAAAARAQGGTISVDDAAGGGARFRVELPVRPPG